MIVKIIGKAHREGTSKKSGNSYNFNIAYYLGNDSGVTGQRGLEILLDPETYPLADIQLGADYNIEFGPRGTVVSFQKVK